MRSNLQLACVLLLTAAGCEKNDPLFCKENPGATGCPRTDGDVTDGPLDDMDLTLDARLTYGSGSFTVNLSQAPQNTPLAFINPSSFSTTAGASTTPACLTTQPAGWIAAGNPEACFLVAMSITINGTLDVEGNRPLVLVAQSTITINADVDASSFRGGKSGPGTQSTDCPAYTVMPGANDAGAGGGAGGSFVKQGGIGGDGNNNGQANGEPTAAVATNPVTLRGGCAGQTGGDGQGTGGPGGAGGGALYLLAGESLTIASGVTINASGAGGTKTTGRTSGGGGGGSGGMILLDAPMITATGALLMANGGGGSSGADDTGGGDGTDGGDPQNPLTRAVGGPPPSGAGAGGDGWIEGDTGGEAADPGASSRGGGGGGGGGGWIQSRTAITGATSSPTVSVL